jgi:hypothetical protein
MSHASTTTTRAPKPKVTKKRPRAQVEAQQTPPPQLNARQVQQLRQQHEQQQQYQHFQHLLQQQKLQHESQQQLAEQAAGGKRRAPAAAAAARRTYIHHMAGQKTKLVELLVRASNGHENVASLADFQGAGRYFSVPASTSVLQLRKFLAARCSLEVDDLQLSLSTGMLADDRIAIARLEEYWVERGPAVVEMKLTSQIVKSSKQQDAADANNSSDAQKGKGTNTASDE